MENKAKLDPIAYGFFKNENLEISERVADALLEAAKYLDISYNKYIMPTVVCVTKAGTIFSSSNSIDYSDADLTQRMNSDEDSLETLISENPEFKEFLEENRKKLETFNAEAYEGKVRSTSRV